jgi:hypothetical protein
MPLVEEHLIIQIIYIDLSFKLFFRVPGTGFITGEWSSESRDNQPYRYGWSHRIREDLVVVLDIGIAGVMAINYQKWTLTMLRA